MTGRAPQDFPLFMDKLPTEPSDDPDIAALQSLAGEETKEERAEHFKVPQPRVLRRRTTHAMPQQSGNECMTRSGLKYWDSAVEYYTRAIQCGSNNLAQVSVYFTNRAAAQILKKNWGHASRDCLQALELDPTNVKVGALRRAVNASVTRCLLRQAMYRAAKAFYEM